LKSWESLACLQLCSGSPVRRWWKPCFYRLATQWRRSVFSEPFGVQLEYVGSVPSPRREVFGGLSPPNKAPRPPNWNLKHYWSVEFLSLFNVKPPLHERKAPPHKRKALLLMTFWWRFCVGSWVFGGISAAASWEGRYMTQPMLNTSSASSSGCSRNGRFGKHFKKCRNAHEACNKSLCA